MTENTTLFDAQRAVHPPNAVPQTAAVCRVCKKFQIEPDRNGNRGHLGMPAQGSSERVNFHLSFLDAGRLQDEWKANFETEHTAICWMWMVGGVCALKHD